MSNQPTVTVDHLVDAYASLSTGLEHEKTARNAAQDFIVDLQDDAFKSGLVAAAKHIEDYLVRAATLLALVGEVSTAETTGKIADKVHETLREFERGEFQIGRV